MTSAPQSPSTVAAAGAAMNELMSSTRTPASGKVPSGALSKSGTVDFLYRIKGEDENCGDRERRQSAGAKSGIAGSAPPRWCIVRRTKEEQLPADAQDRRRAAVEVVRRPA